MDWFDVMERRHSVRQYEEKPIEPALLAQLQEEVDACNREGSLHIQLVTDEPKAFQGFMAHYGSFRGVTNYIALIGPKNKHLDEKCGYYGERLVLKAQHLGLNTCWVALTYSKIPGAFRVNDGEAFTAVISLGYGATQGTAHKSKPITTVSNVSASTPGWFRSGVEAALLAPTAMNQQKFYFTYADGKVTARAGLGFYAKLDLGIVKYHFELGSGKKL